MLGSLDQSPYMRTLLVIALAWVLWVSYDDPRQGTSGYYPEMGAESWGQCILLLDATIKRYQSYDDWVQTGFTLVSKKTGLNLRFTCLPDTVDPRSPEKKK